MSENGELRSSLREHIQELRKRLLIIAVVFIAWCGVGYAIRQPLTKIILEPLGKSVYYNTPQGGFEFFMRVIMTAGFIAVVPVAVHQLLRFIEPAVNGKLTSKHLRYILLWSVLLAIMGSVFAYLVILPTSLHFFAEFGGQAVQPLISADAYLSFILGILATFALLFQLPLIISVIDKIKPIKPEHLTKYRRHIIVGSLVVALILPFTYDPVTQFVIALPIIVLFELSILVVRWNHHLSREKKRQLRVAALVESMHEADRKNNMVSSSASQPTASASQQTSSQKTGQRKTVVVGSIGSSQLDIQTHPRVLDLRNAH